MTKYILLLLLSVLPPGLYAQQENVWVFGAYSGLDFNTIPPTTFASGMNTAEGSASVCNSGGQLLFYTNGFRIWDHDHNLMPNGDGIITDIPPLSWLDDPCTSTYQSSLIVPFPEDTNKYYIFSLTSNEFGINAGRLYYSIVDMTLNGGMGDIVPGQGGILISTSNAEIMTGVVGDRCNIWVLSFAQTPAIMGQFRAYEVNGSGINTTPVISEFTFTNWQSTFAQMNISPNGKKLALGSNLFDFDPATGMLANQIELDVVSLTRGACFSFDDSKLYISTYNNELRQYDISLGNAASIISSMTIIDTELYYTIKRAPDGKIYLCDIFNGLNFINVINYPNLAGSSCGFQSNSIPLTENTWALLGLPNEVPIIPHDTSYQVYNQQAPCFANNMPVTASNDTTGWDYVWNTGATGATTFADTSGVYWVSYHTPPCQFNVDTFHITFETRLPSLIATAGCYDQNNGVVMALPYPGDTATYTYTWTDMNSNILQGPLLTNTGDTLNIAVSGNTYYLNITAANSCDTTVEIAVPVPDYDVSFSIPDTIVCVGEIVSFQNTSTEDIVGFSWSFADGSTATTANPTHAYSSGGSYLVRLVGNTSYPCYDTAEAIVRVDTVISGLFETDRDSICTGEKIVFTPYNTGDISFTDQDWTFGDGSFILNVGSESLQHAYDSAGNFPVTCTVHSRACPDISFTDTVYVFPLPVVNLGADTTLCLNGSPVYIQNLYPVTDTVISSLWNTGDTHSTLKIVHPGKYDLTVKIMPIGCSNTDEIEVKKDCYIDIPNAFTPNGDGANDYFFPRQLLSKKVTQFRMQLFNRWGQVIFESTATDGRGWDGKFNGRDQPAGIYVYVIDVSIDKDREEHYEGNVTLIR